MLSNHKGMISNVGSQDGKLKLVAYAKELLEVMTHEIILENQEHCDDLIKRQDDRAKIPLIVIKALVSGNWCNESEGPNKM